jgi:hypothetical protein
MMALVPDAQRSITVGDVVTFQFPYNNSEALKNRPCIVLHEDHETDEIVIAYGTSRFNRRKRLLHTITIECSSMMATLNLKKPTKFFLDRRIRVRKDDPRFCLKYKTGSSRIGSFRPAALPLIDKIYDKLPAQAKADERQGIHPPKKESIKEPYRRRGLFGRRKERSAVASAA